MCDLLLVINTNTPPKYRFQVILWQIFASDRAVPHINALAGGDPLRISRYDLPLQKLQ